MQSITTENQSNQINTHDETKKAHDSQIIVRAKEKFKLGQDGRSQGQALGIN